MSAKREPPCSSCPPCSCPPCLVLLLLLLLLLLLPLQLTLNSALARIAFSASSSRHRLLAYGPRRDWPRRTNPGFEIAIPAATTSRLVDLVDSVADPGLDSARAFPTTAAPRTAAPTPARRLQGSTENNDILGAPYHLSTPPPLLLLLLAPGPDPPSATLALGPRSYNSYCAGKPLLHLALPTHSSTYSPAYTHAYPALCSQIRPSPRSFAYTTT